MIRRGELFLSPHRSLNLLPFAAQLRRKQNPDKQSAAYSTAFDLRHMLVRD